MEVWGEVESVRNGVSDVGRVIGWVGRFTGSRRRRRLCACVCEAFWMVGRVVLVLAHGEATFFGVVAKMLQGSGKMWGLASITHAGAFTALHS